MQFSTRTKKWLDVKGKLISLDVCPRIEASRASSSRLSKLPREMADASSCYWKYTVLLIQLGERLEANVFILPRECFYLLLFLNIFLERERERELNLTVSKTVKKIYI